MPRLKVVLYNPKSVFYDMPLALLAIGSCLDPERYEVVIIDGRVDKNADQLVIDHCKDALCFGLTALTGAPLKDAVEVTRKVKRNYPQLPIIWGGWHPSLFPTETLRDEPAIDISVQAQGEETFVELVEHIREGADLKNVLGITYRNRDGEIIKNLGRPMQDVNLFPRVNYELIDVEKYFKFKKNRQFDYISSAGCRFRCTFCADPFVYNRGWTALQPERMGEELAHWKNRYKFTDVNFQDETFFTKRDRVVSISKEIINRKINTSWAGTMRADQGYRLTDEEFDLCKKSGLRRVLVGVESGSQEMMDWLKKDIKMEQVYETARKCAARDIAVIFPFIVGFPDESQKSVRDTLKTALALNLMHPLFTTPIFYFKPYPGSKITQDVVAKGYQLPQNLAEWAEFDYIGSSGPWVSEEKFALIERFKFYNKVAGRKSSWINYPVKKLARLRCELNYFDLPLEKKVFDLLVKQQKLS